MTCGARSGSQSPDESKVTCAPTDSVLAWSKLVVRKPQIQSYAAIESEQVGQNVTLSRMRGHVTGLLAEQRFDQFRDSIGSRSGLIWIIETLEVTGFDPGAVTAGARWFRAFKERGGQQVIFVSRMPAARMAAASLAFAVHAKICACDTLKDAYERAGLGNVEPRPSFIAQIAQIKPNKPNKAD